MQPVVADLQHNCSKNVDFVRINVDDSANEAVSRKYGVSSIPQYFLLDSSGKVVRQWVGSGPASEFDPVRSYCATQ
jgi:thioredoxin-related protein